MLSFPRIGSKVLELEGVLQRGTLTSEAHSRKSHPHTVALEQFYIWVCGPTMETIKRRATDFPITRHLGAISPYFKILQQPRLPASHIVNTAVYLFRHGIIHVSEHDYRHSIEPFLKKVFDSQQLRIPFVKDTMGFLSTYSTWITDDDIGTVSTEGLEQTREMGRTFQARYQAWLGSPGAKSMTVWADSADRCKLSAKAFAEGFSGKPLASG